MFALVAAGILSAGIFAFADLSAKATMNQERATRAQHLAEAGMAHTLGLLRGSLRGCNFTRILKGSDNLTGTPAQKMDDSLMTGTAAFPAFALVAGDQIPLAGKTFGGGTYFVSVRDDSADTDGNPSVDMNGRIRVRCRAVTSDGAAAEINAIVGSVPMPGVVTDGSTEISGKPAISGACGSMHNNGSVTGGGEPTATAGASATGVIGPGTLAPQTEGAPPMFVPDLLPSQHCPATATIVPVIGTSPWKPASTIAAGTYCITANVAGGGNVELDQDFASSGAKRAVTIIAAGSIKVSAKPMMKAHHPDGILLLAGGDLNIQGDFEGEGVLFGGGQCYISSKPIITGQLICKNKSPHPGENSVPANLISGDATIIFDCSTNGFNKRRALFWYPRIG
jgi:hypothetical protein